MTKLARRLLGFMAADIGDEEEELVEAFTGKRQSMAMHYYPPCPDPDKVLGITPHTDGLGLTLLLHVDDTPGLQIKKDGRWYPVRPLPGAFLVNIGDILDVLTNGAYTSVEHRVIPDAGRGRTTVVFVEGTVRGMVAPLPGLLKEQEPRYNSIELQEYVKGILKAIPEGIRSVRGHPQDLARDASSCLKNVDQNGEVLRVLSRVHSPVLCALLGKIKAPWGQVCTA
jgi:isopenicillin N synthase-like dioxygenase